MKWHTLIVLVLCAAPMLTLADGPATKPSMNRPGPGFNPRAERRMGGGPFRDKGAAITAEERQEAEQFLKENLPNRYKLFSEIHPNSPMRAFVIEALAIRYRMLLKFRDQDDEMYQQLLTEAKLEDEAIPLIQAVRNHDASAESQLREKATELVQVWIDTRQTRIERLERALKEQKDQLAVDMANKDDRVNERIAMLKKQFNGLLDRMENIRRSRPDKPPVGMRDPETGEMNKESAGQ